MGAAIEPRYLRLEEAMKYCGASKSVFNADFRPFLKAIRIGTQGIAFDRRELDEFLDWYAEQHGQVKGDQQWKNQYDEILNNEPGLESEVNITTSTSGTKASTLQDRLAQIRSNSRKTS